MQGGADDLQVPGQGECFAEQCAAFVLAAGVAKASAERFSDEGRREIRAPLIRYVNRYTGEEFELEEVDLTLVLEAETTLLDNPFKANRTMVRVTLKALEKYGSYARANEWLGVAHLFPHSADNLAGYFSGYLALEPWYSTTYVDWFVRVAESHWGCARLGCRSRCATARQRVPAGRSGTGSENLARVRPDGAQGEHRRVDPCDESARVLPNRGLGASKHDDGPTPPPDLRARPRNCRSRPGPRPLCGIAGRA